MDDRLRVDDDGDALIRHAEEVMGLDRLEALVHQRRRVDRDPPAHRPGRVRERLLDADPGEIGATAERPAGGGQDQALDRAGLRGPDQLEQRRVLGVDRKQPRPGCLGQRRGQLAADHQALLVGEGDVDPLAERDDGRPEPGRADHPVEDEVGAGAGDQLLNPLLAHKHAAVPGRARPLCRGGIGECHGRHAMLPRLLQHFLPARGGSQPDHLKLFRRGDDLQRLGADRAAAAENDQLLHLTGV